MPADLTFFSWPVPEAGFSWLRTKPIADIAAPEAEYLTSLNPLGIRYSARHYDPLGETGLFRNFADLEPTPDAIRKFANKYGELGGEACVLISVRPGPAAGSTLVGAGESFGTWRQEIWCLRETVSLWDAVNGNSSELRKLIQWDGSRAVSYFGPPIPGVRARLNKTFALIASEHKPELLARFKPEDLTGPALYHLQRKVNERLTKHEVTGRLLRDPRNERLGLHIVPRSLLGCMWLQLARAIDGDRGYRRCPDCRKWFEVTPQVSRADRVFCSPTCKARAHRKKIAEARRLFKKGKGLSVREIAKQLETTATKVKGWVQT